MRHYLFLFRQFSGLRCVQDGIWRPTGSPAIYKLLEGVSQQGHLATVILCGKTAHEIGGRYGASVLSLSLLPGIQFRLFPFFSLTHWVRFDQLCSGLYQSIAVAILLWRKKPNLLYVDRAHLPFGALAALIVRTPVVVRMLGVARLGELYASVRNWVLHPLQLLAIRAPFSLVVCSLDGSPVFRVLKRYPCRTTPSVTWLNGVEETSTDREHVSAYSGRILFVGRLETNKGCQEFVEALIRLYERDPRTRWTATMIGGGTLKDILAERIEHAGLAQRVHLVGEQAHETLVSHYQSHDMYVSLNTLGNMSNTVLEAMTYGLCTLLRGYDKISGADEDTVQVIPSDAVVWVDPNRMVESLARQLHDILASPPRVRALATQARTFARRSIPSWDERIKRELHLLELIRPYETLVLTDDERRYGRLPLAHVASSTDITP